MSATVYKVGDELYERTPLVDRDYTVTPVVRTWEVLSVVDDPMYQDQEGRPNQVVTLRAFGGRTRVLYKAEIALFLDIAVEHGTWYRSFDEAFSALQKNIGGAQ